MYVDRLCSQPPLQKANHEAGKTLNVCEFYVCYLTLIYVCVF